MAQPLPVTDFIPAQAANNNVNHWFDREHNVNAAWNAIFHDHTIFPYNQGWLLIHPEAYPKQTDTKGLQNDLRGKGGDSVAKWDDIRIQLQAFIQAAVGSGQTAVCWGIGAKGSRVQFWRYQRRNAKLDSPKGKGEYMAPIFTEHNFIMDNNDYVGRNQQDGYDISADWASIVRILQMMATREPRPGGWGAIP